MKCPDCNGTGLKGSREIDGAMMQCACFRCSGAGTVGSGDVSRSRTMRGPMSEMVLDDLAWYEEQEVDRYNSDFYD